MRGLLVTACVALGCHVTPKQAPPSMTASYKLVPGMRITYARGWSSEGAHVGWVSSGMETVVVLDRVSPDAFEIAAVADGEEPVFALVTADGGAAGPWSAEATRVLESVLPPLPRGPEPRSLERGDVRYDSIALETSAGEATWRADVSQRTDRLFGVDSESRFRFDTRRGVITRVDSWGYQGRGFRQTWEASLKLESVTLLTADALADLRRAVASFRRVRDDAERAWAEAGGPGERPIDIERIRADGAAAGDELLRHAYRMLADRLERLAGAPREASPVGERRDWTDIEDLAGRKHSLDAYAGRVLVLDFWFRDCGYCMDAMPVVRRFEQEARGLPVTVLDVSTDRDRDDADVVRATMGIERPVLLGRSLADLYGVRGCPTLVVLGPDGVIRDVVRGYRERVDVRLANTVSRILGRR